MKYVINKDFFEDIIKSLGEQKQIFVSIYDFKETFAKKIAAKLGRSGDIRVEFDSGIKYIDRLGNESAIVFDVLVMQGNKWYPVILYYRTRAHFIEDHERGLNFTLKNQWHLGPSSYSYCRRIHKLEQASNALGETFGGGYTIFITNNVHFQDPLESDRLYYHFNLAQGKTIKATDGNLAFTLPGDRPGKPILENFKGKYKVDWKPYATIRDPRNQHNDFYYLINEIKPNKPAKTANSAKSAKTAK